MGVLLPQRQFVTSNAVCVIHAHLSVIYLLAIVHAIAHSLPALFILSLVGGRLAVFIN